MAISTHTAELLTGALEQLRKERAKHQSRHEELSDEAETLRLAVIEIDTVIASIERDMRDMEPPC